MMEIIKMWENVPGMCEEEPVLKYFKSEDKKSDGTVVIFPGGGYGSRAAHEGDGYAQFLNSIGINAFVVEYRVSPHRFPLELLDARRAIRWVRYHAKDYEINPKKIAVMGSSAGGHLAAMVSTYKKEIEFEGIDEIDNTDFTPNYQILAYPVIALSTLSVGHIGTTINLLGEEKIYMAPELDPLLIADENTPPAFIWHTSDDSLVNVANSLKYGEKLRDLNIPFELHVFPNGHHGLGIAADNPHVAQWTGLLENWLELMGYFKK